MIRKSTSVLNARANVNFGSDRASKLPLILSICLPVVLVVCYFVFPGFREGVDEAFGVLTSEDEERIAAWVAEFGIWGPLAIIVGMVLQMFLFVIPNILLIYISIVSYGPVWGSLLAWCGIILASTVGYFIGNKLSPVIIHKLVSPKTHFLLKEFIRKYGAKAVIALRVSSFSNDGLSLVAGLLNMRYRRFIVATIIGITPLIIVVAIFGHSGKVEKALIGVGAFLILCLITLVLIDKRRSRKAP